VVAWHDAIGAAPERKREGGKVKEISLQRTEIVKTRAETWIEPWGRIEVNDRPSVSGPTIL